MLKAVGKELLQGILKQGCLRLVEGDDHDSLAVVLIHWIRLQPERGCVLMALASRKSICECFGSLSSATCG